MPQPCPEATRWRDWLADQISASERTRMADHLSGCSSCQKLLDQMSGEQDQWSEAGRVTREDPGPDANLERAMDELKASPPSHPAWFAEPLTFLKSSDHPGSLGRLGDYEVLEEIGRGGNGIVLKAFEPKLHRVVAVKVMSPNLASNGSARERFLREAKNQAAVVHENVVTLHRVDVTDTGLPYLVMEFVAGRSLQDRLDRDGPLSTTEVLRIGMQAAAGLAAAHAVGLVHRDVKPANILLENGVERVKLADFGLVRAADDACLTRSGVIAGSPQYMSPEQARGKALDSRSDLFSLGSVLYATCTGRPPFRAPSPLAVLKRVCDDQPRPIRQINPDVPERLTVLIDRLMAKKPSERFPTAAEAAEQLGQCLRYIHDLDHPDLPPLPKATKPKAARKEPAVSDKKPSSGSDAVVWIVLAVAALLFLPCLILPALAFFGWFAFTGVSVVPNGPPAMSGPAMIGEHVDFGDVPPAEAVQDHGMKLVVPREPGGPVDPTNVLDDPGLRAIKGLTYLGAEFDAAAKVLRFRFVTKETILAYSTTEIQAFEDLPVKHPVQVTFNPASGRPPQTKFFQLEGKATEDTEMRLKYTFKLPLNERDLNDLRKLEIR